MPGQNVWLDNTEFETVKQVAAEEQTSVSALVRVGLRMALGLPVPRWARELAAAQSARRNLGNRQEAA